MLLRMWEQQEPLHSLLLECRLIWLLWKTVWLFLRKSNTLLPYNPAIRLPRSWKFMSTQYPAARAALFITAQTWKKDVIFFSRWKDNKLWSIQTMNFCLLWKRKTVMHDFHVFTWRNLECILLNERSKHEKATSCMIPTIWHSGKCKTKERA